MATFAKHDLHGKLRRSNKDSKNPYYEGTEVLKVYVRLDQEFNGQDYLTLSKTAAEKLADAEDPKAFVSSLEVSQGITDDGEVLWGLQMPENTEVICEL